MPAAAYLLSLINSWSKSLNRFPLFILGCIVACVYFSYLQYDANTYSNKIGMPLILGLGSIFLAYLVIENFQLQSLKKWAVLIGAVILALFYYYCLPTKDDYNLKWPELSFISILVIFHLAYSIIPFLSKKNEDGFLRYNINILENFAESAVLCLILFGLLILALYALKTLFGLPYTGRSTMHLFIWILGLVHSINFLSAYPILPIQFSTLHQYNTRFFKILVLYISIPVMLIYGLITIAYIFKMFLGGIYEPWITAMCGWYIGIGLVVYLFNKIFITDNESAFAVLFNKYFALFSLPIVALFIYCTIKNTNDEGVNTSNYYSIIMCLVSAIIFGLLSVKKNFNLVWVPGIVLIASLFSIISGPLNVWTYPLTNQKTRLVNALKDKGIIKNDSFDYTINVDEKWARSIENNIYAVESLGDLSFLKKYDKSKTLSDTIRSYQLIEKLNLFKGQVTQAMDSKYYDFVPIIKLKEGNQIYPIINKYVNAKKDYAGLRVSSAGNLLVVENGIATDSIQLLLSDTNHQNITAVTQIKKDTFDLYITNLTFKSSENKCTIEDFNGIVVKR
jgi:hypothetical protein